MKIASLITSPALRNPDFRRLWAGAVCNHLGMTGEQVIVGLLVFRITGSTAWVGAALALFFLPLFLFGAFSGAIADGHDRRLLLRRIEAAIVFNLAVVAGVVAAGFADLWILLSFIFVSGSLRALHQPVRLSYAYDVVGGGRVVGSIGLLNIGTRVGQLIGALLAGVVTERAGAAGAFLALATMHVAAYCFFRALRTSRPADVAGRASTGQNLREFFQEFRVNRVLAMLVVLTAAVEIFGFSFATALPELAAGRFEMGAEGLGLLQAARATGGMAAGITLSWMRELQGRGRAYLAVIFAFGIGLGLLAVADRFPLALAALLLVAAMAAASDILTQSMMQLSVSDRLRGRAMGAWVVAVGFAPVGHLEMGMLSVAVGVGNALLINGAALVLVGLFALCAVPRLRRL